MEQRLRIPTLLHEPLLNRPEGIFHPKPFRLVDGPDFQIGTTTQNRNLL